ncbi:MAG: hypothetical protein WBE76_06595 [Terracidiphilus sp.]
MGKSKAQRLQIWPNSANGIEIEVSFCHPDYELSAEASAVATPSKLLRIFSLVPETSSNPTFFGRYDARDDLSGRNKASAVDVDVSGLTDAEERDFKAGKNGFSGHHSTRTKDGQHQILISAPKHGKIFEGTLSMNASVRGELLDICDLKISDSLRIYNAETGEVLFDSQRTAPNK